MALGDLQCLSGKRITTKVVFTNLRLGIRTTKVDGLNALWTVNHEPWTVDREP